MLTFELSSPSDRPLRVLCLGAHCDDIEIGCGGTLLELCSSREVDVHWAVFTSDDKRRAESEAAADRFLARAQRRELKFHEFRNAYLPYQGAEVKAAFEPLKALPSPDLIFTHTQRDMHQDHRLIWELTWNGFRNHAILEYEIPKWDGDLGQPSAYFPLGKGIAEQKCQYLQETFGSQATKHWFDDSVFLSLMRLRGMECHSTSGYAEAFHVRKLLLG